MVGFVFVFFCLFFVFFLTLFLSEYCSFSSAGYMAEKLGFENSKIPELSNLLYKNYGTSMAGLRVCFFFNSLSVSFFKIILRKSLFKVLFLLVFVLQAIGYDFDYDEYHRYSNLHSHFFASI